jgi:hypothetical protein
MHGMEIKYIYFKVYFCQHTNMGVDVLNLFHS